MDETDNKTAREIGATLNKRFKFLKFNWKNSHPISEALIKHDKSDFNAKRVAFPVVVVSVYGAGVNAVVLKIRDKRGADFAMRIGTIYDVKLHQELAKYEMAPRIYYIGKVRGDITYMIMDKIYGTLDAHLKRKLSKAEIGKLYVAMKCLLDKKALLSMLHGDMHTENIVILKDGSTLGFIDFEFSLNVKKTPLVSILDFVPFLGSIILRPRDYTPNVELLVDRVIGYYKTTFSMAIDKKKVKNKRGGGYEYEGGLISYISDRAASDATVEKKIIKEFRAIKMPKIVP